MSEILTLYRFEHKNKKHGMWYNANAEYEPIANWAAEIPMDRTERYSKDNAEWFSAVQNHEDLHKWFSVDQMQEL